MSRNQKYAFRMTMHRALDAQAVGEFLDALIDERKEHVTSEEIVAAARKRDCPLHEGFTWDENDAADKWRRGEAKTLVKNLMIARNDKPTRTRAFVYVHHPEHAGKKVLLTTRSAMARPELREQIVEEAVKSLQRSLSYWAAAYGSHPSMRRLAKNVDVLRKRAERELLVAVA